MVLAAACLLTLGQTPKIEVIVCDPAKKVCWRPDGKVLPRSLVRDWFNPWKADDLLKPKTDRRCVLVRMPWRSDEEVPTVLLQYPDGTRFDAQSTLIPTGQPRKKWLAFFELPMRAMKGKGHFEIGVAAGEWRTTGTRWLETQRQAGKPFALQTRKLGVEEENPRGRWWLSTNLPEPPRYLDWRLQPYGEGEKALECNFSSAMLGKPTEFLFTGNVRADSITRVDLQRRPITWVKFARFDLQGPL